MYVIRCYFIELLYNLFINLALLQWFDYGPKAFTRLPCGIGKKPSGGLEQTLRWCALSDCCLNYAAFTTSSISKLAALQHLTGAGNAIGIPSLPNLPEGLLGYLAGSSTSDNRLSDLFCPFNKNTGLSALPDFSSDVAGCCDIPVCYHKKKVSRTGFYKVYILDIYALIYFRCSYDMNLQ